MVVYWSRKIYLNYKLLKITTKLLFRRRRIDSMFDQSPPRQTGRRTRLAFRKKWSFMWCFSENIQFYDIVVSLKNPNGWYTPDNIQKTNIKAKKPKILPTFFFIFFKKKISRPVHNHSIHLVHTSVVLGIDRSDPGSGSLERSGSRIGGVAGLIALDRTILKPW